MTCIKSNKEEEEKAGALTDGLPRWAYSYRRRAYSTLNPVRIPESDARLSRALLRAQGSTLGIGDGPDQGGEHKPLTLGIQVPINYSTQLRGRLHVNSIAWMDFFSRRHL